MRSKEEEQKLDEMILEYVGYKTTSVDITTLMS